MDQHTRLICAASSTRQCSHCPLNARLKCRFELHHLLRFIFRAFLFILPAGIGLMQASVRWPLFIWLGFMVVFFTLWEIRILCSHCPYYAEDSKVLHCIANYGSPKVWRYHPEPMSPSEKIQLWLGFGIFGLFPLITLIIDQQWLWGGIALFGLVVFFNYLTTRVCTSCVNFSCPLNRVPKPIVDAFLRRNPIMREAWEKHGYHLS